MALDLGELFLTLGAEDAPLEKGLAKASTKAGKEGKRGAELYARSWMGPLRAVGGAAVGLFAISKVTGFFKDSIAQARDSNKIGAITTQVIKSTGGAANLTAAQVGNLSTALSMKTGVDDEVIQSGQNMLLTFKNVRNEAGKNNDIFSQASGIMTDMSVAMGTDTKSAALQLGKALNDPVKGMTALQRVGVTFDAAQQKSIAGYVKAGDTLSAQKVILKELKSEFGGAAAAAATPAQRLAVVYGNLKENVGNALIPILDKGATLLVTRVIPVFSAWFAQIDSGRGTVGHIATVVGSFVGVIGAMIPPLLKFGAGIIRDVMPPLVAMAGNVMRVLIPALKAVGAWILTKLLPALRALAAAFVTDVLPLIKSLGTYLVSTVLPIVSKVAKALGADLVTALKATTGFLREHKTAVQSVVVGLAAMLGAIYLVRGAMLVWAIATKAVAVAQGILNAVMDANPIMLVVIAIIGLAAAFVYAYKHSETFRDIVKATFSAVMTAVHAFVSFFTKTIPAAFSAVLGFVKSHWKMLPLLLLGPFGVALGFIIHFRSQIGSFFAGIWRDVSGATTRGISTVVRWIGGLPGKAISALAGIGSTLYRRGADLLGGLKNGAVAEWTTVWGWIKGIPGKIGGAALGWATTLYDKGGALISGLKNGIWNGIKGIGSWIKKNVIDPIINAVKSYFGIHSPSTVFAGIGGHLIGGLMKGMAQTNGKAIATKVFGDMPHALGHIVKKGIIKVAQLPKKALNALQGLGGDLAGLVPRRTERIAGRGTYVAGGGVARWTNLVKLALDMMHQPQNLVGTVLRRMNQESGGNEKAINLTDINAINGDPSRGLMQTIMSTFRAFHFPGTSNNIYDPLANILASMRYALSRYGSLSAAYNRAGGYDHGGLLMPGAVGVNMSNKPEMVRSAKEEDALRAEMSGVRALISDLIVVVKSKQVVKMDGRPVGQIVSRYQKDDQYGRRVFSG